MYSAAIYCLCTIGYILDKYYFYDNCLLVNAFRTGLEKTLQIISARSDT